MTGAGSGIPSGGPVLVAGGAGALGRVIVAALAERGTPVAVLDRSEASIPGAALSLACDAGDPALVARALDQASVALGPLHGLVNAVGSIDSAPVVDLTAPSGRRALDVGRFDAVVAANLHTALVLGAAFAERLVTDRRPGVIVNLGSVAAQGNPGQTAYAAAKAGLHAMTMTWARELGGFGVRAVTVAPGFIDVESTRAAIAEPILGRIVRETPLRRLGLPQEVAHAVLFALDNGFVTGACIPVDGGLTL